MFLCIDRILQGELTARPPSGSKTTIQKTSAGSLDERVQLASHPADFGEKCVPLGRKASARTVASPRDERGLSLQSVVALRDASSLCQRISDHIARTQIDANRLATCARSACPAVRIFFLSNCAPPHSSLLAANRRKTSPCVESSFFSEFCPGPKTSEFT
jgi:hypothetical protein